MTGSLQALANRVYREVGRVSARVLGSSEIVQSVLIHRSVAAGEVSFGRSDIDLLMVVRQPVSERCDGPELASLSRKVRWMRACAPVVGQIEVHDPQGLQDWLQTDPYRASQERRGAIPVYGAPVEFAAPPIRSGYAVRRMLVCLHTFLSEAVCRRNRRNLRKITADAWNAYATAAHLIPEPYLRRQEAEDHCRACAAAALGAGLPGPPDRALPFLFRTAERLHARLMPPLASLRRPVVFRAQLPPGFQERVFVVLPEAGAALPSEAFSFSAFLCTPEALDLYIHYCNAFLHWAIPPELAGLGIRAPDAGAFVRSCRYFCDIHKLRYPVFMKTGAIRPAAGRVATLRHVVPYLCRGELPPPPGQAELREAFAGLPAGSQYYESLFPALYDETERLWGKLRQLPDLAGPVCAAMPGTAPD